MDILKTHEQWFLCGATIKEVCIKVADKIMISIPGSDTSYSFVYELVDGVIRLTCGEIRLAIRKYTSKALLYQELREDVVVFQGLLF